MKIIPLHTGELSVNTFIVFDENSHQAAVIDPGGSLDKILSAVQKNALNVSHILLTHGHFDHIGAVKGLQEATGAKVYIHSQEADMPRDPVKNLSFFSGEDIPPFKADVLLEDKDIITVGGMCFEVLHTPGHSPGSVCYIVEDSMFCGDTLFYMSVGENGFSRIGQRRAG